ncbi:MAG: BON domain-containing protein [Pyrinomonadaceae bacterium]
MTFKGLLVGGTAVFASAFVLGACGTTTTVNTNMNARNANSNTAIVVNATSTPAARNSNTNVSREEYDKNRADYEKDKGSSTIGQGVNDSWLWFKTKTALATTDDLRDSTINVDVVNDKITLRGTVATAAEKTQAETVAKGIEGQKGVTNQLTVKANDSMTNQMVNGNTSNKKP